MNDIPYADRPYRPCVGIFLLNADNMLFAGRRIDNRAEAWQMPQGGIDHGETVHGSLPSGDGRGNRHAAGRTAAGA